MRPAVLLTLLLALAPAAAQVQEIIEEVEHAIEELEEDPPGLHTFEAYELTAEEQFLTIDSIPGGRSFVVTFHDRGRDSVTGVSGGGAQGPGLGKQALVGWEANGESRGWKVRVLTVALAPTAGNSYDMNFAVNAQAQVGDPYFEFNITVDVINKEGHTTRVSLPMTAYSPGRESFSALPIGGISKVKPLDIIDREIIVSNGLALHPRAFDVEVQDAECGLDVAVTQGYVIGAKSRDTIPVSITVPADKIWYYFETCKVVLSVSPSDNPFITRTVILATQINGFYIDPALVMWGVGLTGLGILLFIIVARRKARLEEEILGKPQRPWNIPAEAVYLKHLKAKDERAWYVVRHFLMEEEHASAMLWFKAEKGATKGTRAKERLIVRQEAGYDRWTRRWERKIDRPVKKADRFDAKLQRKLDRGQRKHLRKAQRSYSKQVKKLTLDHDEKVAKAMDKWEKKAAKADKKGRPLPAQPEFADPVLPEPPAAGAIQLRDHKWQRKADRFRRRMERKQARLERRFERVQGKRLKKVRRKVRRVGRKLDDPAFAAEHPLLADPASS